MSETYILCEGYHDRAFWSGLLRQAGCVDPGAAAGGTRKPVSDPWGRPVRGGVFAFQSKNDAFIRIVPCHSRSQLLPTAQMRLQERNQHELRCLVLHADSDVNADGTPSVMGEMSIGTIEQLARKHDPSASLDDAGNILMDQGRTKITLLHWKSPEGPTTGLPNQQTLERLVCASIHAAYPGRGDAVDTWLRSRPNPPVRNPKEHAWSYLAGWYAERGSYEGFLDRLWDDDRVATEVRKRLIETGIWSVVESIANS